MDIEIIYNEDDFIEFEKKLNQLEMILRQYPESESDPQLFRKWYDELIKGDRNNNEKLNTNREL